MEAAAIIAIVAKAIKVAVDVGPTVIETVENAKPFATAIYDAIKGKQVTQGDLDALEARIDDLAAQLQEPLPPE